MMRIAFILLLTSFCQVGFPQGSDSASLSVDVVQYHVATNGSDQAEGSQKAPFATIEKALAKAKIKPGTIFLHDGDYLITKPIELDSSFKDTDIRSLNHRKARLIGAQNIDLKQFTSLDESERKRARSEVASKIVCLDLKQTRMIHNQRWKDVFPDGPTGLFELYSAGKRLPLSRYPNEGFMKMGQVLQEGDSKTGKPGVFEFKDTRHLDWQLPIKEKHLWLKGFWRVAWQSEYVRIESIDKDLKKLTMAGAVSGGIGSKYHRPNGSGEEPYLAVNLLEEIDQPGEWAINFDKQKLYLLPTEEILESKQVQIADNKNPLIRITETENIQLNGLKLESHLGNGVEIIGGRNNQVISCLFHNIGEAGVVIKDGSNHLVRNCEIRYTGAQGVLVSGGDRKTLTPCNHQISNNHIHHFARIKTIYAGGVHLDTVGAIVRNNLIHDTPHVGIHYKGNNNLFEYNELYHIAQVSNDMGGFYTWGDWTSRGNKIQYNFVHSSPQADGVYCDDGDSGDHIQFNLFWGLHSGVLIGGGRDNLVANNVAIDCQKGYHLDDRGTSRGYNLENRRMVNAVKVVNHQQAPWSEVYPNMVNLLEFHPELPVGNHFKDNQAINCKLAFSWRAEHPNFKHSKFTNNRQSDLPVDPILLLRQIDNGTSTEIPQRIPLSKIGLERRR